MCVFVAVAVFVSVSAVPAIVHPSLQYNIKDEGEDR